MYDELNKPLTSALEVRGVIVLRSPTAKLTPGLREATVSSDGQISLGDIITAVNGQSVRSVHQLAVLLDELRLEQSVSLAIVRVGNHFHLVARLQGEN